MIALLPSPVIDKAGEFVRSSRNAKGWSLRVLSDRSGVKFNTLARKERGEAAFDEEEWAGIAGAFSVEPDELMQAAREWKSRVQDSIPLIHQARAGAYYTSASNQAMDGQYATEWVRRGITTHPKAFALEVTGNSMEPRVRNKDLLVCEPIELEDELPRLEGGRMVVVTIMDDRFGESLQVGRFQWASDRTFILRKDNPTYDRQPETLSLDLENGKRVVRLAVVVELRVPNP